jgi:hypothetical protein
MEIESGPVGQGVAQGRYTSGSTLAHLAVIYKISPLDFVILVGRWLSTRVTVGSAVLEISGNTLGGNLSNVTAE